MCGGARQVPHQSRKRRVRRAPRRAVRHDLQGRRRPRQAGTDRGQRRLPQPGARHGQDAGEHRRRAGALIRRHRQRVHGDLGAPVNRARSRERLAQGPDHRLDQGVAPAEPHGGLSRSRPQDGSTLAPGLDGGRHGHQGTGLVGLGDRHLAERRHRRHGPDLLDASPRRRSPGRGLRHLRAVASLGIALLHTEHHGMSRLRPYDQHDVSRAHRAD